LLIVSAVGSDILIFDGLPIILLDVNDRSADRRIMA
jgi:hypothetical protein